MRWLWCPLAQEMLLFSTEPASSHQVELETLVSVKKLRYLEWPMPTLTVFREEHSWARRMPLPWEQHSWGSEELQKYLAEERTKLLGEMDQELGISTLVEETCRTSLRRD